MKLRSSHSWEGVATGAGGVAAGAGGVATGTGSGAAGAGGVATWAGGVAAGAGGVSAGARGTWSPCVCSQEAEGDGRCFDQLALSPFCSVPDCSSPVEDCGSRAAWVFPSQLTQSRKSITDCPEVCFHGDCQSHQLTFLNDVLSIKGLSFHYANVRRCS